jgi:hypothetical protein
MLHESTAGYTMPQPPMTKPDTTTEDTRAA